MILLRLLNHHSSRFNSINIFQAELNGGNQTGLVLVDPVYSKYPNKLYQMSSVPHIVGGRYLFRVDDIVRKGGCSNLTAGTCKINLHKFSSSFKFIHVYFRSFDNIS